MKIGDKVVCSDGTEYILAKPSDDMYDFGLINHKGREVNCVKKVYLEDGSGGCIHCGYQHEILQ